MFLIVIMIKIISNIIFAEKEEPDPEGAASADICVVSMIGIIGIIIGITIKIIKIYAIER